MTAEDILGNVPEYTRYLPVREIDALIEEIANLPGVTRHEIGKTIGGEGLDMLEMGKGGRTALMIGVPHSDEPLGSLVIAYFARWLATHPGSGLLNWKWLFIPILEREGMYLNEGWFNNPGSFAAMARTYFRYPTEDQYEWNFPIVYKDYEWSESRPETLAVKRVLEKYRPELLCGLHHSGFDNAYYYLSHPMPEVYPRLKELAASLRLPLSDSAPDVPFGRMLSPGIFKMYGLRDYIDYYSKIDPVSLSAVKRGACSDEWYREEVGGFSFNCEVPMYLSSELKNKKPSRKSLRRVKEARHSRMKARTEHSRSLIEKLRPYEGIADRRIMEAAEKHVENAISTVSHEASIMETIEDRIATKAEVFENEVLSDLTDLFFMGQVWRVAESICIREGAGLPCRLMENANIEIQSLAKSIEERGGFFHLPIGTGVKMQLGSILIIWEALKDKKGQGTEG